MNKQSPTSLEQSSSMKHLSSGLAALHRFLAGARRSYKQLIGVCVDALIVAVCLWAAYSLRFGYFFSDFRSTWHIFVLVPALTVATFYLLGVYKWVIRSANRRLFGQLFKGSIVSALMLLKLFYLLPPDRINPKTLLAIYGLLVFFGSVGVRVLWRALFDRGSTGEPVAIYGAGAAGQQLVTMLDTSSVYKPVVLIDDDDRLAETTLLGLPIASGSSARLGETLRCLKVGRIILAMPSITSAEYHKKLLWAESLGLRVLTMPGIEELMTGSARADEIRDVSVNDILGRSEVALDNDLMARRVTGKSVLVTGGGGSIGSELCRQVMKLSPSRLIIVDNCEANLYHITEELKPANQTRCAGISPEFIPLLGSVTNKVLVKRCIAEHHIDTVFHAAAYKHVPIVEAQPEEGIEVNIFGTLTVLDAAITHGVSDFVLISTDKAVRPTNAMGATKRIAELVLQAKAALPDQATRVSMVRFGNVLGSSGSVVPKFKRQILEGGPITLTHSEVTRYFMTIPEAAQLVLQASAIARGGDVFVLDMGEPVKILDLAKTMVRLYGKRLSEDTDDEADIGIEVLGLRPGEKLYEELFLSNNSRVTEVPKISTSNEVWLEWPSLEAAITRIRKLPDAQQMREEVLKLAFIGEAESLSNQHSQATMIVPDIHTQPSAGEIKSHPG